MKRILLPILFALLWSQSALAASSLAGHMVGTAGAEPITLAYTIIGSGNVIVVCTVSDTTFSITDGGKVTSWSDVGIGKQTATNGGTLQCFSGVTNATGSDSIVCHGQFGDTIRCSLIEITGVATTSYIDPTPVFATAAIGSAMDSGAFVTTATDFLVGWGYSANGTNPVASGSWTISDSDAQTGMIYQASKASGTYHATETAGGALDPWGMIGFGVKDAGGGGGATGKGALTMLGVGGCGC